MKKSAKLLGAAGVIAFSTGCLGAFTASADPFVATLPVTTIATPNGYNFEVTNTTSEALHVDFTYGAYLFSAFQFSDPNLRTVVPGATADYAYTAAPLGEHPPPGTTPATQGQFFIELSDLPGARDYQLFTLTRFAETWAAVVDGATYDGGTFNQLFGCAGFPSSGRGCTALNFLYPPSLNPGATILGGEASVSFPIIPEPASIALFSTCLFGLGPALWRRRISARRVTAAG
jgi:hypothetical protein